MAINPVRIDYYTVCVCFIEITFIVYYASKSQISKSWDFRKQTRTKQLIIASMNDTVLATVFIHDKRTNHIQLLIPNFRF